MKDQLVWLLCYAAAWTRPATVIERRLTVRPRPGAPLSRCPEDGLSNELSLTKPAGAESQVARRTAHPGKRPRAAAVRPATRRERAADIKREIIMDAALNVFSRSGLHGARIEQVAERADVSKTNLLYYFSSKEVLYIAVLERMLTEWLQPLRDLRSDQDPAEALAGYIRHKMELSRTAPAASRLFCMEMLQGAPMLLPILTGSLKKVVASKSVILRGWARERRIADVAPAHILYAIWGVTQHYADFAVQVEAVSGSTMDDKRFAAHATQAVLSILMNGLLPR